MKQRDLSLVHYSISNILFCFEYNSNSFPSSRILLIFNLLRRLNKSFGNFDSDRRPGFVLVWGSRVQLLLRFWKKVFRSSAIEVLNGVGFLCQNLWTNIIRTRFDLLNSSLANSPGRSSLRWSWRSLRRQRPSSRCHRLRRRWRLRASGRPGSARASAGYQRRLRMRGHPLGGWISCRKIPGWDLDDIHGAEIKRCDYLTWLAPAKVNFIWSSLKASA